MIYLKGKVPMDVVEYANSVDYYTNTEQYSLANINNDVLNKDYIRIVEIWKQLNICKFEDINNKFKTFPILFTYHSLKIENNKLLLEEVNLLFTCDFKDILFESGRFCDILEVINHKEYFTKYSSITEDITLKFIKEVHYCLMRECYDYNRIIMGEKAGTFKKYPVTVGGVATVKPEDVESRMYSLLESIKICNDILFTASYFHNEFEAIHPFSDGNGRVGRILLNYFLIKNDYPPVIIFDNYKNVYFTILHNYGMKDVVSEMIQFLKLMTVKTWYTFLDSKECVSDD